jgi:hypothetical protein
LSYGAVISRLRVQRYTQFLFPANFWATFFKKKLDGGVMDATI